MVSDQEPDIAGLFAPVDITHAVRGVLDEAEAALTRVDDPVDAELWGSDVIGALTSATGDPDGATNALVGSLIPAAAEAAAPHTLAVLRIFAAVGSPGLREAAARAAADVAAQGVADAPWAKQIGSPQVGDSWHYADVGGRQESLTLTFAYGAKQHALSVLIDHGRGGAIKDVWVAKGPDALLRAELAAGGDPLVIFEMLDPADARKRLEQALAIGESPEQPDQADDIAAHRAFLHARLSQLADPPA
jgi:hypothetical protein